MRLVLLALTFLLVACGGEPDTPVVGDRTDVTVTPETSDPDTLLVEDGDLEEVSDVEADAPDGGTASTGDAGASEIDASDAGEADVSVARWAGDQPIADDGTRFLGVPPVLARANEAFGVEPGLMDRLLGDPALYDAAPIEAVGSMLGLTFEPTAANPDNRTLHMVVADDASHVFAFLAAPDGGTFYRASYDASAAHLPAAAAAWMSRKAGIDFAAMVRENDETVLGP